MCSSAGQAADNCEHGRTKCRILLTSVGWQLSISSYDNREIDRSVGLLRSIVAAHVRRIAPCLLRSSTTFHRRPAISAVGRGGQLMVGGDNRFHEFSGWEKGYAIACEEFALTDDDLILFANDTFNRQAGQLSGYAGSQSPRTQRRVGLVDRILRRSFPAKTRLLGLDHQLVVSKQHLHSSEIDGRSSAAAGFSRACSRYIQRRSRVHSGTSRI